MTLESITQTYLCAFSECFKDLSSGLRVVQEYQALVTQNNSSLLEGREVGGASDTHLTHTDVVGNIQLLIHRHQQLQHLEWNATPAEWNRNAAEWNRDGNREWNGNAAEWNRDGEGRRKGD